MYERVEVRVDERVEVRVDERVEVRTNDKREVGLELAVYESMEKSWSLEEVP